jgi:hypothetical protein
MHSTLCLTKAPPRLSGPMVRANRIGPPATAPVPPEECPGSAPSVASRERPALSPHR